jgi:hypothetical protein
MAQTVQDPYRIPPVFAEAIEKGFPGFRMVENPMLLMDPADPNRSISPSQYSQHTIVNGRTPNSEKQCSQEKIASWREKGNEVLARGAQYRAVALIGGMPVSLLTNSVHAINFWKQNWYLGDPDEVEAAAAEYGIPVVKMRAAVEERDPSSAKAFYCQQNNETVFWNTDYYGQMKSWALGAAGVELARYNIHSIHSACVAINAKGVLIIAPTGTGKSTYTNVLANIRKMDSRYTGKINSDDWVYVRKGVATPSERYIYVRTNAVSDEIPYVEMGETMRHMKRLFDKAPAENVPVHDGRRFYCRIANSRCMINPADISTITYSTPIHLVILLRRDSYSPFEKELDTAEALEVLEKGEYMIQPGSGPKEKWGKLACEPWYNPYLLSPDRDFERRMFASYKEEHGARYVIYNTGAEVSAREFGIKKSAEELTEQDFEKIIMGTAKRMLTLLEGV